MFIQPTRITRRAWAGRIAAWLSLPASAAGCHEPQRIKVFTRFVNRGSRALAVTRFHVDGMDGHAPGYLGPALGSSAHTLFIAGPLPARQRRFAQVEWIIHSDEYSAWLKASETGGVHTRAGDAVGRRLWEANPQHRQCVDLGAVLEHGARQAPGEAVAGTPLRMAVTFWDDRVDIARALHH